jgi:hypothetical protein
MKVKDMLMQDLPDLYPGLTRAGIEQVAKVLDEVPGTKSALSVASTLMEVVPSMAARIGGLEGDGLADYLSRLRGAALLALQMWKPDAQAPSASHFSAAVEASEGD